MYLTFLLCFFTADGESRPLSTWIVSVNCHLHTGEKIWAQLLNKNLLRSVQCGRKCRCWAGVAGGVKAWVIIFPSQLLTFHELLWGPDCQQERREALQWMSSGVHETRSICHWKVMLLFWWSSYRIAFCFMSFHRCFRVSEWQVEPEWPSLCWRYSAISAGNLYDSFPLSSSTSLLEALSSCTLALLGTAALEAEGAVMLWWLQRLGARIHSQMLVDSASLVEFLRRRADQEEGMVLPGWKRLVRRVRRRCTGGETTPETGTVHLKDGMPKT